MAGGAETINDESFTVWEDAVRETLDTPLFEGTRYRSWTHQTYGEFLAAWYLKDLSANQLRTLIFHPDGKLVPQLREVGAWLASMRAQIFDDVLRAEPDALLKSDITTGSPEDKSKLVGALLRQIEKQGWSRNFGQFRNYVKLDHPGLAAQIRPYLEEKDRPSEARVTAIYIAEECRLRSLQGLLAGRALDEYENSDVRVGAAAALVKIADPQMKARLRPLALIPLDEIVDRTKDRLKQYGLEATWPINISAEEIFASLPPVPKGDYIFRGNHLPDVIVPELDLDGLQVALSWVEEQPRRHELTYSYDQLINAIMLYGWQYADDAEVARAYARAILSRLTHHDPIVSEQYGMSKRSARSFQEMLLNDSHKRRKILALLIPELSHDQRLAHQIQEAGLVTANDIQWLVDQFSKDKANGKRIAVAELLQGILWWNINHFSEIYEACRRLPELEEALGRPFDPVALESELANRRRKVKAKRQQWKAEVEERQNRILEPSPKEQALSLLGSCEAGEPEQWWCVVLAMRIEPDGSWQVHELNMDLEAYPVWQQLSIGDRRRVVDTAKEYLMVSDPDDYDWLASNREYRPVTAGYKAFRLLWEYKPNYLEEIPDTVWEKWAKVLLVYMQQSGQPVIDTESVDQQLVRKAYEMAPEAILTALDELITLDNEQDQPSQSVKWSEIFWDDEVAQVLHRKVQEEELQSVTVGQLLHQLLVHHYSEAEELAVSILSTSSSPLEEQHREKAIAVAHALLRARPGVGWESIWPLITSDAVFGRTVIEKIVGRPFHLAAPPMVEKLSERQLSQLFAWLVEQYPPANDPELAGSVTSRHNITDFRNAVRDELWQRATSEAITALRQLADKLPEVDLRSCIRKAEEKFRRETWVWPSPSHILELSEYREKGLVNNGAQLLDVIVESLQRLQESMHGGKNPAVSDLWNKFNWRRVRRIAESLPSMSQANFEGEDNAVAQIWRHVDWKTIQLKEINVPKDESELANYIARHLKELQQRGIIVNREVQVRHGRDRTDIYVDAFKRTKEGNQYNAITAVVEVKGCWNRELDEAMQSQLVNRYLQEDSTKASHGIYLVGYFGGKKWHDSDRRKKSCQDQSVKTLQETFEEKAVNLSETDLDIRAFILDASMP